MTVSPDDHTSEEMDALNRLIRTARGKQEEFTRPDRDAIAAYLLGTATEDEKRTVQDALARSGAFRREMLEMAADIEALEGTDFLGTKKNDVRIAAPGLRDFLARYGESGPGGRERESLWAKIRRWRLLQVYAPAAAAVAALVLLILQSDPFGPPLTPVLQLTEWNKVEDQVEKNLLIATATRSGTDTAALRVHESAREAALVEFSSMVEWTGSKFRLSQHEDSPGSVEPYVLIRVFLVDEQRELIGEFEWQISSDASLEPANLSVWALGLPTRALLTAPVESDSVMVEWGIYLDAQGCLTLTYLSDGGYRALRGVTFELTAPASHGDQETDSWAPLLERADSLAAMRDFEAAAALGEQALKQARSWQADGSLVANILHSIGKYYYYKQDYETAAMRFERASALRMAEYGELHRDVTSSLHNLATTYGELGKYPEAAAGHLRVLGIKEQILEPGDLSIANTLDNLGQVYIAQARFREASPVFERALQIRSDALGNEDPRVAAILNSISMLEFSQGDYREAEELSLEAIRIVVAAYGEDSWKAVKYLNNLGVYYMHMGKYAAAERLFIRVLVISEGVTSPDPVLIAHLYNNLGLIYHQAFEAYSRAEDYYGSALAAKQEIFGAKHKTTSQTLDNLASLKADQGYYDEAEALYRQVLANRIEQLGPEHPEVAWSLRHLASLHLIRRDYVEAERLLRKSLNIRRNSLGTRHPLVAQDYVSLGGICVDLSRFAEAESYYAKALAIGEDVYGQHHPALTDALLGFSKCYRLQGRFGESLETAQRAFDIRWATFTDNVGVLSEKDALTFAGGLRRSADCYLTSYVDSRDGSDHVAEQAINVLLAAKGQVIDEMLTREVLEVPEADPASTSLADSLREARFRLSQMYLDIPEKDNLQAYRRSVDSLTALTDRIETGLARRSSTRHRGPGASKMTLKRLVRLLPPNTTIIAYYAFDYQPADSRLPSPRYVGFSVGAEGSADIVDLGPASTVDSLVSASHQHMLTISSQRHRPTEHQREAYASIAHDLYEAVVKPFEEYTSGRHILFLSPDGSMNMLSFAALVDGNGNYMVESCPIHYISAPRDFARFASGGRASSGLLAFADPDFGELPGVPSGQPVGRLQAVLDGGSTWNVRSGASTLQETPLAPLPETRREIEGILEVWRATTDEPYATRFGLEASEGNFKSEAPGHRVIHIATHGYFIQAPSRASRESGWQESECGPENPLLRSGLYLAGANLRGSKTVGAEQENGVLTAIEVAGMDLRGTDFVVLSACESGLGSVVTGEGVYGLRSAFKTAGARTVVSALWRVDDKTTASMMDGIYAPADVTLPERLRDAQIRLIESLRAQDLADHPYTWGAFVAIGDWD